MMQSTHGRWWSTVGAVSLASAVSFASLLQGCGEEAKGPNRYYAAAETAFKNGCGSRSNDCHQADGDGDRFAQFALTDALAAGDIRSVMVNVPSCEYDLMDRIEPGDPDNSWIMVKITGEFDETMGTREYGDLLFTPEASWSEEGRCASDVHGFGKRMPSVAPFQIPAQFLSDIRTWIEHGAPGPDDPETSDGGV